MSAPPRTRRRLPSEIFDLPVEKMREGYYSDAYFVFTKQVLERDAHHPRVLMQVFQRHQSVLGGMDEAIAVLRECCGHDGAGRRLGGRLGRDRGARPARRRRDRAVGDRDDDRGRLRALLPPRDVYLGTLSRRTLIARNVREVVRAARGKPILYFPARHDHHRVQTGDGYAAHIAGAIGVSTDAQASWWGGRGMGTVPHGLIAAYGGDTVLAARRFVETLGAEMDVIVLVDFDNDCVGTALAVASALGPRLWGVRLDTSATMVDRSLSPQMGRFDPRGVNPQLVRNVREALDREGFSSVAHRRLGRVQRGQDRVVRGRRGARRRLRRRLGADPRRERLHGGRRGARRPSGRQGRSRLPAEPAPRARDLSREPG